MYSRWRTRGENNGKDCARSKEGEKREEGGDIKVVIEASEDVAAAGGNKAEEDAMAETGDDAPERGAEETTEASCAGEVNVAMAEAEATDTGDPNA